MGALCLLGDTQAVPSVMKRIEAMQNEHVELLGLLMSGLVELKAEQDLIDLTKHKSANVQTAARTALRKLRRRENK